MVSFPPTPLRSLSPEALGRFFADFPLALLHRENANWRYAEQHSQQGPLVEQRQGRGPYRHVLLTAPHGGTHLRDLLRKPADQYTASLVQVMGGRLDAPFVVWFGRDYPDPVFSRPDPEPVRLREALVIPMLSAKVVLDVHGMKDSHGPDICIGMGPAPGVYEKELAARLEQLGKTFGFDVSRNTPFRGDRSTSITSLAQSMGIVALQLEIAHRLRDPVKNPEGVVRLAGWIAGAVELSRQVGAMAVPDPPSSSAKLPPGKQGKGASWWKRAWRRREPAPDGRYI